MIELQSIDAAGEALTRPLLPRERIVIGRGPTCEVSIADKFMSLRHVVLEVSDGNEVSAEDVSTNGTLVEGQLLRRARFPLRPGSRFVCGQTSFSLRVTGAGTYAPIASAAQASPTPLRALVPAVSKAAVLGGPKAVPPLGHKAVVQSAPKAAVFAAAKALAGALGQPGAERESARAVSGLRIAQASAAPSVATSSEAVPREIRMQAHQRLLKHLELDEGGLASLPLAELRPRVLQALRGIVSELLVAGESSAKVNTLVGELADEALGLGPLEALLADPEVTEIMVVDPKTIFVERGGRCVQVPFGFTDDDRVRAVVERIVTPLGRRIDESSPLVDARLPDGSRVNAVIPPLALRGTSITIRKFPRLRPSMTTLIDWGSLDANMGLFLERCIKASKNIVVSGGTGSGKTTLLNVLSSAVPAHERIVTIEDSAELQLTQPHVVGLETRPANMEGKGQVTIRDLVKNALRMRPDRIIVGECRGGEALDMLQAMNTGHDGSLTTVHANSPREAIKRLETLCLMAGVELPIDAVRGQIASSVHLIVQQARLQDGSRKVIAISEVAGMDSRRDVVLRDIYRFEQSGISASGGVVGEFMTTGYLPSFLETFIVRGLMDPQDPSL